MAFDTKAFLLEAGFTEAELAELAPKITEERAKKLEGMVLRQSDYSRSMNDLKKAQGDLSAANDRLTQEIAEWAQRQASDGEVSKKQQAALEKAQQQALKAEQALRRVAGEVGIDADKLLEGTTVVPPKPEPVAPDLSGYAKVEHLGPTLRSLLHLPAQLRKIENEHFKLFGEWPDSEAIIAEVEKRASTPNNQKSTDPRTVWEELHQVPTKRADVEKARIDGLIAEAEKRGREAAASEMAVPGNTPRPIGRGPASPVLHPGGQQRTSVLQRGQPGTTVGKAVAALRSGKYAPADGSATK